MSEKYDLAYGELPSDPKADPANYAIEPKPSDIFAALSAANVACSGYSSNGVNVWGDRKSIDAVVRAFHEAGKVDDLVRNLRHWRDECGKLHAQIAAEKDKGSKG